MTSVPVLHALVATAHRWMRRVRISWLRADLTRLELAAYSLAIQPDYPGATTHLAYLLAQAAALRLRIRHLEQQR